jgi:hypothetical protein
MSSKFANHLLRDRKGPASEHSDSSAGAPPDPVEELKEQVIVLGKEDIRADDLVAPALDWSTFEKGEIAVQLKDTEGLADGRVTIRASTLQRIYPALLPIRLEADYLFPISLKTVVLQVQTHLRESSERPNAVDSDFDTLIAQVAREDEGFFKLAKVAESKGKPIEETALAKRKILGPVLTPADRPASSMLRTKFPSESTDSGAPLCSRATRPAASQTAGAENQAVTANLAGPKIGPIEQVPHRRTGLERLQEIFMTEDQLDAPQVASLLAAFPKVSSAVVMQGDGTVLGGNLPEGYHLATALLAPVIMRSVQEFNRRLRSNEVSAFTLLGDQPVTLFAEGNVYILVSHQGRGLLPGVRERIGEVARALDALCG